MTSWDRNYALGLTRQKRRRAEALKSRFAALIATPQALAGGVAPVASAALVLPANARLAIASSIITVAGDLVVNVAGGRVLGTPALAIDEIHEIGYVEAAKTVAIEKTNAGAATVTLYFLDEWKRPSAIATCTFT